MTHDVDLLEQVERDLLEERPLATVLRSLILLGDQAASSELRDWATGELRGYDSDGAVPAYRRLPAAIQINGVVPGATVRHQTVPVKDLPDFAREDLDSPVPIRMGVGEIQAAIDSHRDERTVQLTIPGGEVLAEFYNRTNPAQRITNIYWSLSTVALEGLLDQIRTRLAQLIAELKTTIPPGQRVPSAAQAANAIHVIIHGERNHVRIEQTSAHDPGNTRANPPRTRLGRVLAVLGAGLGALAAAATVVTLFLQLWPV